jgi:hypothetical protein
MSEKNTKLQLEGERAAEMLSGKTVSTVRRHRPCEVAIEFTDGMRLFVDHAPDGVELSITEGRQPTP